jgi:hypothetical protein
MSRWCRGRRDCFFLRFVCDTLGLAIAVWSLKIMANDIWRIEGEYFESCNCELLCPCLLSNAQARPTEGHCDVVLAIHIRNGNYGTTDLSGLSAA